MIDRKFMGEVKRGGVKAWLTGRKKKTELRKQKKVGAIYTYIQLRGAIGTKESLTVKVHLRISRAAHSTMNVGGVRLNKVRRERRMREIAGERD